MPEQRVDTPCVNRGQLQKTIKFQNYPNNLWKIGPNLFRKTKHGKNLSAYKMRIGPRMKNRSLLYLQNIFYCNAVSKLLQKEAIKIMHRSMISAKVSRK